MRPAHELDINDIVWCEVNAEEILAFKSDGYLFEWYTYTHKNFVRLYNSPSCGYYKTYSNYFNYEKYLSSLGLKPGADTEEKKPTTDG